MFREHHCENEVRRGSGKVDKATASITTVGQGSQSEHDTKCASIATRNATPQASASGSTEPHKTTEPTATIQVAAGSSKLAPVTETGRMAGTGTEQTRFHAGKQGVESVCDAECDAISADRVELLVRAVVLVAGINLTDAEQAVVFARVVADLTGQRAAAGADPPWPTICSRATS